MRALVLIVSVIGVLLGALWLLQGLGLVEIRPILCFANCEPVQGPSRTWAGVGFLLVAAGAFGILRSLKPRRRR
jgi:hypothetical protein